MESSKSILTKLFAEYYLSGAQAKKDGRPLAFITAFTPVELLRAAGVFCMYPESYAVVCAASNKAPDMIAASPMGAFTQDLCSYSLIDFGIEHYERLPYGGLPEPDLLVATNNQCGTTLLWFKLLAQKKNIPLFVIDYPALADDDSALKNYVRAQYNALILWIGHQTSNTIDRDTLAEQVACSRDTGAAFRQVHALNRQSPMALSADKLVNALFPIVTMKGTRHACDYYRALLHETPAPPDDTDHRPIRLLWHGYPMWYLPKKFPAGFDGDFQIALNDYTLWWDLDYGTASDPLEALATAYSGTYLNWPLARKLDWVQKLIADYAIDAVICHANRSCRRSLADILPLRQRLSEHKIPSVIIESDMANPAFYSKEQISLRIESFKETLIASRQKETKSPERK